MKDTPLEAHIRAKWHTIRNRCKDHPSYIKKRIKVEFTSYSEFRDHCLDQNYRPPLQIHRKCKDSNYNRENTTFLTKEEHIRLSGIEKRKFNPSQVQEIKQLYDSGLSTWKLAEKFRTSQPTIWKLVTGRSYRD